MLVVRVHCAAFTEHSEMHCERFGSIVKYRALHSRAHDSLVVLQSRGAAVCAGVVADWARAMPGETDATSIIDTMASFTPRTGCVPGLSGGLAIAAAAHVPGRGELTFHFVAATPETPDTAVADWM